MNYLVKMIIKILAGIFLLAWLNKIKESAIENFQDVKNNFKL